MKDGAIVCNAGHFNVEINIDDLERLATKKELKRDNIMGYKMPTGAWVNLLAEGRLVNRRRRRPSCRNYGYELCSAGSLRALRR